MNHKKMLKHALKYYGAREFPALAAQCEAWEADTPLDGAVLLDATPIFNNTIIKYAALAAAGAEIWVSALPTIPFDPDVAAMLSGFGIKLLGRDGAPGRLDVVLDCGAAFKNSTPAPRFGFSELTRTGAIAYADCPMPVFVADDSVVKEFETSLGTGDGFVRALDFLGIGGIEGKNICVIGCGKVGRGIIHACAKRGARVAGADVQDLRAAAKKFGAEKFFHMRDAAASNEAMLEADIIVSATGIRHSVSIPPRIVADDKKIFANMGVEEEFDESVPADRALNRKRPLNFILPEPTLLKYIDPTLALHNFGARELIFNKLSSGPNKPDAKLEREILKVVKERGAIDPCELSLVGVGG